MIFFCIEYLIKFFNCELWKKLLWIIIFRTVSLKDKNPKLTKITPALYENLVKNP